MTKPKKRTSTAPPGDARDRPKVKATRRNKRYDFPAGYTLDGLDRLVPPQQSPMGSIASSIVGSRESLLSIGNKTSSTLRKIKPIVVNSNFVVVRNLINNLKLTSKPLLKIVNNTEANSRTQILCANQDDKVIVITELAAKKFAYHTYAEVGQRQSLFLIKHHHRVELEEMKNILDRTFSKSESKPSDPKFLYDHKEYPVYLVAFKEPSTNINTLRQSYKSFDGLLITWEIFDNRRKRPMPCRRCKMWGHAASGCGHKYRCIKCADEHEPGECSRKDRNKGDPKCVNCKGPHIASSQECEAYKKYLDQQQRRRPIPIRRPPSHHPVSLSAPVRQGSPGGNASKLNPNSRAFRSYANTVSGPPNLIDSDSTPTPSRSSNFASAFADFASIPDIARTMELFNEMNAKIRATKDHYARIAILAEYCTPRNGY